MRGSIVILNIQDILAPYFSIFVELQLMTLTERLVYTKCLQMNKTICFMACRLTI